jgi:hypothetical protein
MKHIPRALAALAATLLVPALLSCHNGNGTSSGGGSGSGGAPNLRVVDLALDAPYNFDVLDGTTSIVTNLGYGQATAFQAVSSGGLSIKFEPTGTTTTAFTASPTVGNGDNYSVIALQGTSALTAITVAQVNTTPASGQARLTFVNAAPAVNGMDFYVTGPTATLPASPSLAAVTYVGDAGSIAPPSLSLASGTYRIRAIANGDATLAVVYDSGPITFAAGDTPLLVMTPVTGSASTFALVSIAANSTISTVADQRVQVRVGNFAPANGAVDTYFDLAGAANSATTLFQTNIASNGASGYAPLLPGAYRASFTVSGSLTELVGSDLSLAAGSSVSVFAAGLPGLATPYNFQLLAFRDDLHAPASGMAKLRLVDLAPDIGSSVDLVALTTSNSVTTVGQRIVISLPYAGASGYAVLPAGSYVLAVVPTGTVTPVLPTSAGLTVVLAAGSINTLVLAGCEFPTTTNCPGASTPLQFVTLGD